MRRRASLLLALAFATAPAFAVEVGALFTTPEERARLDRMRRGEAERIPGAPERATVPAFTGYVQRSDGRNTVWLDGVPVPTDNPRARVLLDPRKVEDDGLPLPPRSITRTPPGAP